MTRDSLDIPWTVLERLFRLFLDRVSHFFSISRFSSMHSKLSLQSSFISFVWSNLSFSILKFLSNCSKSFSSFEIFRDFSNISWAFFERFSILFWGEVTYFFTISGFSSMHSKLLSKSSFTLYSWSNTLLSIVELSSTWSKYVCPNRVFDKTWFVTECWEKP